MARPKLLTVRVLSTFGDLAAASTGSVEHCRYVDILTQPFLGGEALEAGLVTKSGLRHRFEKVYTGVYVHGDVEMSLEMRARAAWLWSHREGVIAGLTASALHGAEWVEGTGPIEMVWTNARATKGIHTYDYRLCSGEFLVHNGMRTTTVERTAYDVGRFGTLLRRVQRLDALGNATRFEPVAIAELARSHRGARGLRNLRVALELHDPGAESPQETWLRLLLIRKGFPRPETQIPVAGPTGRPRYRLDMGWEDIKVAVEYDGEHHRTDDSSYRSDILRLEYIQSMGWIIIRVVAKQEISDIVQRVAQARAARLRGDREVRI